MSAAPVAGAATGDEARTDGREVRGARRRAQLLEATLAVLARDGVGGVSHRAVAREAGVAVASVSYHFGTIDDLLLAAIRGATDEWATALRSGSGSGDGGDHVERLAVHLAAEAHEHRERAIAEYELYLMAARRPALRAAATAWLDVAIGPLTDDLDDVGRRLVAATLDGICLHGLMTDDPPGAGTVEVVLRRALAAART